MIATILSSRSTGPELNRVQSAVSAWAEECDEFMEQRCISHENDKTCLILRLADMNEQLAARFDDTHLLLGIDQKHAGALKCLRIISQHVGAGFSAGLQPHLSSVKTLISEWISATHRAGSYMKHSLSKTSGSGFEQTNVERKRGMRHCACMPSLSTLLQNWTSKF